MAAEAVRLLKQALRLFQVKETLCDLFCLRLTLYCRLMNMYFGAV